MPQLLYTCTKSSFLNRNLLSYHLIGEVSNRKYPQIEPDGHPWILNPCESIGLWTKSLHPKWVFYQTFKNLKLVLGSSRLRFFFWGDLHECNSWKFTLSESLEPKKNGGPFGVTKKVKILTFPLPTFQQGWNLGDFNERPKGSTNP